MNQDLAIDIVIRVAFVVLSCAVAIISYFLKRTVDRLDSLDRQHDATRGSVIRVESELSAVKETQRHADSRVERIENRLSSVQNDTSAILSSLQHLAESLRRIDSQTTEINERLSRLEGRKP